MRGTMCLQLTDEKWTIKRVIRDHVHLLEPTAGSYLVLVPVRVYTITTARGVLSSLETSLPVHAGSERACTTVIF